MHTNVFCCPANHRILHTPKAKSLPDPSAEYSAAPSPQRMPLQPLLPSPAAIHIQRPRHPNKTSTTCRTPQSRLLGTLLPTMRRHRRRQRSHPMYTPAPTIPNNCVNPPTLNSHANFPPQSLQLHRHAATPCRLSNFPNGRIKILQRSLMQQKQLPPRSPHTPIPRSCTESSHASNCHPRSWLLPPVPRAIRHRHGVDLRRYRHSAPAAANCSATTAAMSY